MIAVCRRCHPKLDLLRQNEALRRSKENCEISDKLQMVEKKLAAGT